jgi:zinc transport system substrate-binding protein
MLRRGWLVAVVAAGMAALAAAASAAAPGPDVVVTIKPIHSLVTRLMQGVGTPTLLVEGASTPHAFALKPSGARAINSADIFIRVAPRVEPFTEKIIGTLPDSVRVVTLAQAPGLKLRGLRASGTFERHGGSGDAHDDDAHAEGGHGEDEHQDDAADIAPDIATGNVDGHVWLDPDNAKAIVAYLADVLSERAPGHADKIRANARALQADLDALTAELTAKTAPLRDKPFVVFHDAYQYFEQRFGLDAVGAITVSPDVPPSAKRLTELRHKIRQLKAVCVFAEPMFQPHLVDAVTEDTGARSGTLDPLGTALEPGGELYFTLLRSLAAGLSSCLERAS